MWIDLSLNPYYSVPYKGVKHIYARRIVFVPLNSEFVAKTKTQRARRLNGCGQSEVERRTAAIVFLESLGCVGHVEQVGPRSKLASWEMKLPADPKIPIDCKLGA